MRCGNGPTLFLGSTGTADRCRLPSRGLLGDGDGNGTGTARVFFSLTPATSSLASLFWCYNYESQDRK
ncbi:hypothetical protein Hdeb2414_s0007g00237941 [Helianthus debilis subsp. tardiflorus]